MTDPDMLARGYLALWNDPDNSSRDRQLEEAWTTDARYTDPMMAADDRAGIAAMIANVRANFPGHVFALQGKPDGHGCFVRFSWSLAAEGGTRVAGGTDVVRLNAEGRIAEVIGFLDRAAA